MSHHIPDNWVIIKIKGDDPHYRVLAGWSGGYTQGSSWKLNSGITQMVRKDDYYLISGQSGSMYMCHKEAYGLRLNNAYVWQQLVDKYGEKVELMEELTDWSTMDWIIG